MSKPFAWSISSLEGFETCPKRHFHLKVRKDVVDVKGEEALWGTKVHKHLEDRLLHGISLPLEIARYEPMVAPFAAAPGQIIGEQQLAVTADFKPTSWFGRDAWCRGIVDAGVLTRKQGVLLDWKTGKRKPGSDQLKLFSVLAFAHYPELQTVKSGFVWLKENKIDKEEFQRDSAPAIWQEFMPRVIRMQRAVSENKFPPKPSGLCRKYCPVPSNLCEFSGKK